MATNVLYNIVMALAWKFAQIGGINQGVVSTLIIFASVFNVINFYCFYGEKVTIWQGFGIFFMVLCIACIGIESSRQKDDANIDKESNENEISKVVSGFLGILFGLSAAMLMSTKHIIIRIGRNNGYSGFDQALDSCVLEGIVQSFLLIPLLNRSDYDFKWADL